MQSRIGGIGFLVSCSGGTGGRGGGGCESRNTFSELLKWRRGTGMCPAAENMAILSLTLHSLFSSLRHGGTRTGDRGSSTDNFLVGGPKSGIGGGAFSISSSISAGLPTVKGLCSV